MTVRPSPKRRRRVLLRLLVGLGLVLLLAGGGAGWWVYKHGEDWLEVKVRERIAQIIDDASVPGYTFSMNDLLVDTRTGHLQVTNVELDFAPELLDSLRSGHFRYLFAARVGRIELRGLSFWRLILRREFRVDAFEMLEPEISYLIGGERISLAEPLARLDQGASPPISLVLADTFLVRRAAAIVEDLRGDLPRLALGGLTVESRDVRITMGERRGGVRLALGEAGLDFDSLRAQLPDGDRLHIGRTQLSRHGKRGLVEDLRLIPAEEDTTDLLRHRRPVVDLHMDSILLQGLDLDRLIAYQALHIEHFELRGTRVNVTLDKTLLPNEPVARSLPTMALRDLAFDIRIDTVTILRASGSYRERDGDTHRWGEVPIEAIDGRFTHVTNIGLAIEEHPRIEGDFACVLFEEAILKGQYAAELDGSDRFTVTATVTDLPLKNLNGATRPLLRVQVNGGRMERMEFRMEGDNDRAKGTLMLNYSDLLVRVEPGTPREMRHSMFGSVIETMLKEAYGGGLSAERESKFSLDRDPHRSLITYLWHGTREGLARNLAPEAWDRMRLMLRVDAEQRREQRELRKQRRQDRR